MFLFFSSFFFLLQLCLHCYRTKLSAPTGVKKRKENSSLPVSNILFKHCGVRCMCILLTLRRSYKYRAQLGWFRFWSGEYAAYIGGARVLYLHGLPAEVLLVSEATCLGMTLRWSWFLFLHSLPWLISVSLFFCVSFFLSLSPCKIKFFSSSSLSLTLLECKLIWIIWLVVLSL